MHSVMSFSAANCWRVNSRSRRSLAPRPDRFFGTIAVDQNRFDPNGRVSDQINARLRSMNVRFFQLVIRKPTVANVPEMVASRNLFLCLIRDEKNQLVPLG